MGSRTAAQWPGHRPGPSGGLLPPLLAACEQDPDVPQVELGLGAARALRDGRADAALLYAEREDFTGLATEELQVVLVPRGHRLARLGETAGQVSLADLDGEVVAGHTGRGGPGAPPAHPPISDTGQLIQLIALGRMVAVKPASARRLLGEDLTAVPVRDAPSATLVLAWPGASRSRALAALVRCAARVASETAPETAPETAATRP